MQQLKLIFLCLIMLILCPSTIYGAQDPLVFKYRPVVEKINNYGTKLDKCYTDYTNEPKDINFIEMGSINFINYEMSKCDKLENCYLTVLDEIYNEYYFDTKDTQKEELTDYMANLGNGYIQLFMELGYCQPACGKIGHIKGRQYMLTHLKIYIEDLLEFLLQRTINVKPNFSQD